MIPSLRVPILLAALTVLAAAQTFTPVVADSIHDEPRDGLGDSFNSATGFPGLIREQPTREDRAIQEFDVTAIAGATIASAMLVGTVNVNNAFDNGLRTFDFLLYQGNGQADLSDFEIAATVVGAGSYQPPLQSSFNYAFDVTATLQALLNGGALYVGLKVDPTSSPNFPNILSQAASMLVVQTGTPASAIAVGSGCGVTSPTLTMTPPVLGAATTIAVSGALGSAGGLLVASPGVPVPVFVGFGCVIQVDIATFFVLAPFATDPAGDWQIVVPLPPDPMLSGLTLTLQAVIIPTPSPFGADLTNGVVAVLGS